jgi:hypothetical protein
MCTNITQKKQHLPEAGHCGQKIVSNVSSSLSWISTGFTQSLTEMSTRTIKIIMFLGSKVLPMHRADKLTAIC